MLGHRSVVLVLSPRRLSHSMRRPESLHNRRATPRILSFAAQLSRKPLIRGAAPPLLLPAVPGAGAGWPTAIPLKSDPAPGTLSLQRGRGALPRSELLPALSIGRAQGSTNRYIGPSRPPQSFTRCLAGCVVWRGLCNVRRYW